MTILHLPKNLLTLALTYRNEGWKLKLLPYVRQYKLHDLRNLEHNVWSHETLTKDIHRVSLDIESLPQFNHIVLEHVNDLRSEKFGQSESSLHTCLQSSKYDIFFQIVSALKTKGLDFILDILELLCEYVAQHHVINSYNRKLQDCLDFIKIP